MVTAAARDGVLYEHKTKDRSLRRCGRRLVSAGAQCNVCRDCLHPARDAGHVSHGWDAHGRPRSSLQSTNKGHFPSLYHGHAGLFARRLGSLAVHGWGPARARRRVGPMHMAASPQQSTGRQPLDPFSETAPPSPLLRPRASCDRVPGRSPA